MGAMRRARAQVRLIAEGLVDPDPLVSDVVGLDEVRPPPPLTHDARLTVGRRHTDAWWMLMIVGHSRCPWSRSVATMPHGPP